MTTPSVCLSKSGTGTERRATTSWERCRSVCPNSLRTPSTAGTSCSVRRRESSMACRVQTRSHRAPPTCTKLPGARYYNVVLSTLISTYFCHRNRVLYNCRINYKLSVMGKSELCIFFTHAFPYWLLSTVLQCTF